MIMVLSLLVSMANQPVVGTPTSAPIVPSPTPPPTSVPLSRSAETPRRAQSLLPLPKLFSTDDYPLDAIRKGESGTASLSIAIGPDGRVTGCTAVTSSGSASLDQTSCAIIRDRARFRPALDANGRPVVDQSSARIRWQLPAGPPLSEGKARSIFTIDAAGRIIKCRQEGKVANQSQVPCQSMMQDAKSFAANLAKTTTLANRELVNESGMLIGGPDGALNVGRGQGEVLSVIDAVSIAVDARGSVTRCVVADGRSDSAQVAKFCSGAQLLRFAPLDPATADRSDRHAVLYWATYTRPIR